MLRSDSHLRELIKGSALTYSMRILGLLSGVFFTFIVSRLMGASTWGTFAIFLTLLNLYAIVAKLGVDISMIKFLSDFREKGMYKLMRTTYWKSCLLVLPVTISISLLAYFSAPWLAEVVFKKPHLTPYLSILALSILPMSYLFLNTHSFRGIKEITLYSFHEFVGKFGLASIFFLLIFYFFHVFEDQNYVPIVAYVISVTLLFIFSTTMMMRKLNQFARKANDNMGSITNKDILRTSLPMLLSTSTLTLMGMLDTFILNMYHPEAAVGVYNVALRIAVLNVFSITAVNSIAAPKFSELYNNGRMDEFKDVVKKSTTIIFFTTVPITIVLIVFPKLILSIFGPEFIVGYMALIFLVIGKSVTAFSGSTSFILQMTGREKVFQNILVMALIINIVLNFILIPKYAINGAAMATAISTIFWNLACVLYIKKKLKINSFYVPPFLAKSIQ